MQIAKLVNNANKNSTFFISTIYKQYGACK
jgi:hypothetical protein